jgi:hypothetical protein
MKSAKNERTFEAFQCPNLITYSDACTEFIGDRALENNLLSNDEPRTKTSHSIERTVERAGVAGNILKYANNKESILQFVFPASSQAWDA